jgi:O-antigen ligase
LLEVLARSVSWSLLVALGLAPLIFGANVPFAWGLNAAIFGFLLISYVVLQSARGQLLPVSAARLAVPMTAFGLVLCWIALQLQPWVPQFLHAPEWARAAPVLEGAAGGRISVNPSETFFALLRLSTAVAVFLLTVQIARDPKWAVRVVWSVALAAAAQALYALVLAAAGPDNAALVLPGSLFKVAQVDGLTGTFYNRNHLAIFLAIGLACTWGLLSRDMRNSFVEHGFRDRRETMARGLGVGRSLLRYSMLLMPLTVALLLTTSRAGVLLALSAILLMVFVERSDRARRGPLRKVALAIVLAGSIFALATGGETVGARFAGTNAASTLNARMATAVITAKAIADRPVLGYGYGTFESVFPGYRDDTLPMRGRWKEAHNSYLEAALGLGIPMAFVLFGGFAWIAGRCVIGARTRRRDRLAPCVAVGVSFIVGLHALVDFSIQIQGIALGLSALLAAGYAQSWSSRDI